MEGYRLRIIQGVQTDSILALNSQLSQVNTSREADHQKILELSAQSSKLTAELEGYTRYESMSSTLRPELKVLFPQITAIGLSRMAESVSDSTQQQHFVMALVSTPANKRLTNSERQMLHDWLQARIIADSILVIEK